MWIISAVNKHMILYKTITDRIYYILPSGLPVAGACQLSEQRNNFSTHIAAPRELVVRLLIA